jgi:tRNA (cmo5U34)-methyltransferase
MQETSKDFFNQIVSEYDDLIKKHVTFYADIFWTIFRYLPNNFAPKHILELGCGTGNLTKLLHEKYPDAKITAVDAASEMLKTTNERLKGTDLTLIESYFEKLDFKENSFDLIISNLAIHHLVDEEKQNIFNEIRKWLKPGGLFVLADAVRAVSDKINEEDWVIFKEDNLKAGMSIEDLAKLVEHSRTCDHYATVPDLLVWLKNSGFKNADVLWRCSLWAVFQAEK